MKRSLFLFSILLPFLVGGSALGAVPLESDPLFEKGEFGTTLKSVRFRAERGDAMDQFDLGMMYLRGSGVTKDLKAAVKWFTLAAKQGYAKAQYRLGLCYDHGWGVHAKDKVAVKWYTLAAKQGDAEAQNQLGLMYLKGLGVPRDPKVGTKWITLAAQQGEVAAQSNLGQIYATDIFGVSPDFKLAIKWATLAAEQGRADAQVVLGKMYYWGKAVSKDNIRAHMWFSLASSDVQTSAHQLRRLIATKMSPADIAKAEKLARECVANNYQGC